MDSVQAFHQFFDHCVGSWATERTYHYLTQQEVERSRTEFVIHPVAPEVKTKVLADNEYPQSFEVDSLPGFYLAFDTVSEKGEKVSQALNMLFVTHRQDDGVLVGDYLRDRAYEEAKPMVAKFRFDPVQRELLMTTTYTRVVAVDSITLVNPKLRIRKIVTYRRPEAAEPLDDVVLVGFGVEQKQ
jgi:hypothetical protein